LPLFTNVSVTVWPDLTVIVLGVNVRLSFASIVYWVAPFPHAVRSMTVKARTALKKSDLKKDAEDMTANDRVLHRMLIGLPQTALLP
jgi:hypothetical protein